MGMFDRFLPKKKPVEIKNNIPKEKESIKKSFFLFFSLLQQKSRYQGREAVSKVYSPSGYRYDQNEPLSLWHHQAYL